MSRKELVRAIAKEVAPYPVLCFMVLLILDCLTPLQKYYPLTYAGVLPIILFFSGLSIHSAGTALSRTEQMEKAQPIFISIGIMMTGYALWKEISYLIDLLQNNILRKKEVLLFRSSLPVQQHFK